MNTFDPAYQDHYNGPLTQSFRDRLQRFRTDKGATLQDIGTELGVSGAFVSKLLNPAAPANISTKHVPRIVQKVEHAEIEYGWRTPYKVVPAKSASLSLDQLVDAIEAMGYSVTLTRKPR
jgi:transcriptional regulator with XRE-family HTH domain